MREWGCFENSTAAVVEKSIEFAGRDWKPNRQLAYLKASFCHSLPLANSKRRGFTAATLANSFASATNQLFDFEHRLAFYGNDEGDEICGTIAAAEFPEKDDAIAREEAGEAVAMNILFALWRKAERVEKTIEEIATGKKKWSVSMEVEWPSAQSALWDGKKFFKWSELSADERSLVKPNTVEKLNGKPAVLVIGGEDSSVLFTGGALTCYPADKSAEIESFAGSESPLFLPHHSFNTGWRKGDWEQAVASIKPIGESRGGMIIGKTTEDKTGHCHEIASDFSVLPGDGDDSAHTHYMRITSYDANTGGLDGLCSTVSNYSSGGKYKEHFHKVHLGPIQGAVASRKTVVLMPKIDYTKLQSELCSGGKK